MKTFLCSLIIFSLLCVFIFANSFSVSRELDEMLALAENMPSEKADFENGGEILAEEAEKLYSMWDKSMSGFAFVMSYDLLDRADQAIIELYCAVKSESAEEFLDARTNFCDALKRLKILCGAGFESFA